MNYIERILAPWPNDKQEFEENNFSTITKWEVIYDWNNNSRQITFSLSDKSSVIFKDKL